MTIVAEQTTPIHFLRPENFSKKGMIIYAVLKTRRIVYTLNLKKSPSGLADDHSKLQLNTCQPFRFLFTLLPWKWVLLHAAIVTVSHADHDKIGCIWDGFSGSNYIRFLLS